MLRKSANLLSCQLFPLLLASLPSGLVLLVKSPSPSYSSGEITKLLLLYLSSLIACLLIRQLHRELHANELASQLLDLGFNPRWFLLLRELVRHAVGVCLMLAWIAGLLYLGEQIPSLVGRVPLSLLLSLSLWLAARLWCAGLNALRLTQED